MELHIRKLMYEGEARFSIFETGQFSKPIVILTELQLQRFETRIKQAKKS